jgi:hypothetical protein
MSTSLRVLMMSGVSQATQAPVSSPNREEQRRNIQYSEHLQINKGIRFAERLPVTMQ